MKKFVEELLEDGFKVDYKETVGPKGKVSSFLNIVGKERFVSVYDNGTVYAPAVGDYEKVKAKYGPLYLAVNQAAKIAEHGHDF